APEDAAPEAAAPESAAPESASAEAAAREAAAREAAAVPGAGCTCGSSAPTATATATAPGLLRRPVTPGKPLVQIVMPLDALTGAGDGPCELVGYGPIPAEQAREIAADAVWRRLVSDPLSGALLDHGRTTYHPPAALAEFVRGRDVYCRFPLCRRRALDAELDHTTAWTDDGVTSDENLYAACPHHHMLKHHGGWTVVQQPDGRITWTTPTGHSYTTEPHDYRTDPPSPQPARPPEAVDPAGSTGRARPGEADPLVTQPHTSLADLCADPPDTIRFATDDDPPPF
ncbi:MAG: HNH endonuclease, partial [Pseudonocardia sp.]|nr:HNH endonuclease [Pseudonocardia sp.]